MTVEERDYAMQKFEGGVFKVLVTTNACSRRIDVSQATNVINYDVPYQQQPTDPDYATYLRQIGRTGHFGKNSVVINFIDSPEDLQLIQKFTKHFQKPIRELDPSNIVEAMEKDDAWTK